MVNSKKRDILEQYRFLLENNLVLTDELLRWIKSRKVFPDFVFDDIKALPSAAERNKKFVASILDNGDVAFTRLFEGLISHGQPFLGELLESEDKKSSEPSSAEASERIVVDDDILKKCPGVDKLRADTREKLKNYLQEQLLKIYLNEKWKAQNQGKSVELINLKRLHYETQQKLVEALDEEKRQVAALKEALRVEQIARQQKEDENKELRSELGRLQTDFEQKWSSQMKMNDANNRSVFKMNDKIGMLADWLRSLDTTFKTNAIQTNLESDTVDQLQNKLKRYTSEIESLKSRGIGTDQLKGELFESIHTSRSLPIEDGKNRPFYDLLIRLYGSNQITELSSVCTKDGLQSKAERDQTNDIRLRDIQISELNLLNQSLQAEINRLKATDTGAAAAKPSKPQWRPVPSTVAGGPAPREKTKGRQTLKPISVQFGTKPAAN